MLWKNTDERTEERAVSPVIGVIMMVAVAVILAAIVSMLVLGMGQDVDDTEQATFSFEYDGTDVTVTHEGGDTLDASKVEYRINGGAGTAWGTGDVTAGDSISFAATSGDEIHLVYVSDNGDTHTLARYTVP